MGVRLDRVVNQVRHDAAVAVAAAKHPPAFGIDLLVDDPEGVRIEGERSGFAVLHIREDDLMWCDGILLAVGDGPQEVR
jgi:hypothetical protein